MTSARPHLLRASLLLSALLPWAAVIGAATPRLISSFGDDRTGPDRVDTPRGVAVANDEVYVVDSGNRRIQVFDQDGHLLRALALPASVPGTPASIGVRGRDMVLGLTSGQVVRLDIDGRLLSSWDSHAGVSGGIALAGDTVVACCSSGQAIHVFDLNGVELRAFGSVGNGRGSDLQCPRQMALAPDGRVWVSDTCRSRLVGFQPDGTRVAGLAAPSGFRGGLAIDPQNGWLWVSTSDAGFAIFVAISPDGIGQRQIAVPSGSAVGKCSSCGSFSPAAGGELIATDSDSHRVYRFSSSGSLRWSFGSPEFVAGSVNGPRSVAVDGEGNLLVGNGNLRRVDLFTKAGQFIRSYGTDVNISSAAVIDQAGYVYIVDVFNIRRYRPDGTFERAFGDSTKFYDSNHVALDQAGGLIWTKEQDATRLNAFTLDGAAAKSIFVPGMFDWGLDPLGHPVVAVYSNGSSRTDVYDRDGTLLRTIGGIGLRRAVGDRAGNLWGTASYSDGTTAIDQVDASGTLIQRWQPAATGEPLLGLAIDADDNLVITNYNRGRVKTYQQVTDVAPCVADDHTLCLAANRFKVQVSWHNQYDGTDGRGGAVRRTDLAGFFYFSDPANIELILKVLPLGGTVKVFYGQLTDLEFTVTVTDTQTGSVKAYRNSAGNCGAIDQAGFPGAQGGVVAWKSLAPSEPVEAACTANANRLCLLGGRFAVTVDWRNQFNGESGRGSQVTISSLSGQFYYTSPDNVELLAKVLDFGDRFLFLYGALSDLEYTIHVTDTATGATKSYFNPAGQYCGGLDNDLLSGATVGPPAHSGRRGAGHRVRPPG